MDSMVDFLYELEKIGGRKMFENAKIPHFWANTPRWYRYQRSGTGTMIQWAIGTGTTQIGTSTDWQWITGTGTGQSGTGTTTSNSLGCAYFCTVKSSIRIPIVKDPKK